jgi:hypothetical protein
MLEAHLHEIFRRALWTALAAPLALASGCGGAVGGTVVQDDGGHVDSGGADTGSDSACGVCKGCQPGYSLLQTCVGGLLACGCTLEGSTPDAGGVDAGDPCHPAIGCGGASIPLSCFDAALPGDGASFSSEQCVAMCGSSGTITGCDVQGSNLNCYGACLGRRPPGMCSTRTRGPLVGRYFADAAQLEAASVDAFDVLRRELEALGAPRGLVEAAATAKEDEVRHARMTARLARRFGGKPTKPRMKRPALRSLEALAIENAVEGCVRETFGALFAMHQAEAANDPHVRATMASIAPDETRHAALGWAVAAWADAKLDADARARVEGARREAIAELRREIERAVPEPVAAVAGLPTREVALAMLGSLAGSLWNHDAATLAT